MNDHSLPHDQAPQDMETHAARALRDMLAGREPQTSDLEPLSGALLLCLLDIFNELYEHGKEAARKRFAELREGRPWLARLVSPRRVEPQEAMSTGDERRIRFLPDSAFENRPPREWLIPTILPKEGIALVFGPSGCGKTFLTMAWSLCIASGTPWLGREVTRGPVAYIAAEGGYGIGPRMKAWKQFQGFSGESDVQWFDQTVILPDPSDLSELRTALEQDFTQVPVLVVFDTLSRCSAGVDENSNTEIARLISAADRIQQEYHCTVLIVHHTGKEGERGPRGASALIGNTETIIEVAKTGEGKGCSLTCFKQKDAAPFTPLSLTFQSVQYGQAAEESSIVLINDPEPEAGHGLRESEQVMLSLLTRADTALNYAEWRQVGMEAGLKERTAERAIQNLVRDGYVQRDRKCYSVAVDKIEPVEDEEPPAPSYPDPVPPEESADLNDDLENFYCDPEPDYASYEEPEDYDLPPDYPEYNEEQHFHLE